MDRRKKRSNLTDEELKEKERLMRSGELILKRGTGRISEKFWTMPRPEDPEGLLLKALLEDRGEG